MNKLVWSISNKLHIYFPSSLSSIKG